MADSCPDMTHSSEWNEHKEYVQHTESIEYVQHTESIEYVQHTESIEDTGMHNICFFVAGAAFAVRHDSFIKVIWISCKRGL